MHLVEAQSSPIKALHYSREGKWLVVWFRAGGVHQYFGVSEYLYRRLLLNQEQPKVVLESLYAHPFKRLTRR